MFPATPPPIVQQQFTFNQKTPGIAIQRAGEMLKACGFSLGLEQDVGPRGLMFGDYLIGKYASLSNTNIQELDGRVEGGRKGPVTVTFYHSAPRHAVKHFAELYQQSLARAA